MPDSRPDTYKHIGEVQGYLYGAVAELLVRARGHDQSKLVDPELSMFDEYRQKLDEVEHDSPEYKEHLKQMGQALEHHYEHNRHHPEHHAKGVHGMNLFDLLEMLCDWMAANGRNGGLDVAELRDYISGGAMDRFGYGPEIRDLLLQTIDTLETMEFAQ